MTTQQDASVGLKAETVFGTAVVVDKFFEFLSEDFDWIPTFDTAAGMRYGKRVVAGDRRVLVKEESNGSLEVELMTKGMGALFTAALGTGVSTQIGATIAYQQLITPGTTDYLPSYTIQVGVPPLGGGAANAQTYAGMVCGGFELTAGAGIPTLNVNFLGKSMDTSTSLAVASYPASNSPYSFVHGAITIGGTVTLPTSTTLASGGTAAANVRDFSLTVDNTLDSEGFTYGGAGKRSRKPAMGLLAISGSLTAEYDSNVLRDAFRNQTDLSLVLTFTATTAIVGSSYPTIQVTIPNIRLDGEMPKPAGGDVITQTVPFTGMDNRSAGSAIYVAIVTAETAI